MGEGGAVSMTDHVTGAGARMHVRDVAPGDSEDLTMAATTSLKVLVVGQVQQLGD